MTQFKAVIIPLPIGFFDFVDKFDNEINVALHIKSKCGVCPFITQPKAINPSNFLGFSILQQEFQKFQGL